MSVPAPKRNEHELTVITKATDLANYTIRICANENNFPKRYRWCITNQIVETVINICKNITIANAVVVTKGETASSDYSVRRKCQTAALSQTYGLLALINIAYKLFNIDSKRIEYWTMQIVEVQKLIRGWRDSDKQRYNNGTLQK